MILSNLPAMVDGSFRVYWATRMDRSRFFLPLASGKSDQIFQKRRFFRQISSARKLAVPYKGCELRRNRVYSVSWSVDVRITPNELPRFPCRMGFDTSMLWWKADTLKLLA